MRTPLQDQLLKAGLAKKSKLAQVVREQNKQRHAKGAPSADVDKVDAAQLQAERAERDRVLAAERNAQARVRESHAQVRQIIESHMLPRAGEIAYAFDDAGSIKRIMVDASQRTLLAKGTLVIARHGDAYALLPRLAADKVVEREPAAIVLDHGRGDGADAAQPTDAALSDASGVDAYYDRFKVPDDLIW
ncbi:MAG: DUF2058 domain-containing protein [Luteimonas sp.]